MPQPHAFVGVDEQLLWIVPVPESAAGTSGPAAPEYIAQSRARFDELAESLYKPAESGGEQLAALAARLVLRALADLPELPFIGEPFGGEGGTD